MRIATPVLLAALVVLSMGVMGTVGTNTLPTGVDTAPTDSASGEITECTKITEPGSYVVTQDITQDISASESPCIHVTASDVVIDGQGYEFAAGTAVEVGADDRRLSNVTVKNVRESSYRFGSRIVYNSVDGGTVTNVTLKRPDRGVGIFNSSDISVRESTISGETGITNFPTSFGVNVRNSSNTTITANTFPGDALLQISESTNTTITNNYMTSYTSQEQASGSPRISLTLESGTSDTLIARNNISGAGVKVAVHTVNGRTVIDNNTITENEVGVLLETHNGTLKIRNNELVGNDYGVRRCQLREGTPQAISGMEDVEIRHNVIANNSQYGVLNEEPVTLNATQNYWGASSGPSSANDSDAPFEDPVTGTPADGEGDAVSENPEDPGISNSHFNPWLNQSVTNTS